MTTLGLFSSPKFASIGDPYRDPHRRGQGRDMKKNAKFLSGNAGNRGQRGRRGCFSRFTYGFAGDRFEEPAKRRRRQRHAEKQKMLAATGTSGIFRPTNPAKKKSAGSSGDGYGTFGGNIEHIDDGRYHKSTRLQDSVDEYDPSSASIPKMDVELEPRNFLTSPAKRGGYGPARFSRSTFHTLGAESGGTDPHRPSAPSDQISAPL